MIGYEYTDRHVYVLVDAGTGLPFYVGSTGTPTGRLRDHDKLDTAVTWKIKELRDAGSDFAMRIIGSFRTKEDALEYECYLISKLPGLINITGHPDHTYSTAEMQVAILRQRRRDKMRQYRERRRAAGRPVGPYKKKAVATDE